MNAATIAIRIIMTSDNQPPRTPLRKNHHSPTESDIMHAYAIDTLFDPSYHTTDTEEIETKDALRAPDKEQFIAAIRVEVDSLIKITKTLVPITSQPRRRLYDHYFKQTRMEDPNNAKKQAQEAGK